MKKTTRVRMAATSSLQPVSQQNSKPISPPTVLTVTRNDASDTLDHFVERDGWRFAGTHLIIDLWHASHLDEAEVVKAALRQSVAAAGATLLKLDLHCFTPSGGVTGVAMLAESHISIHTWPEYAYAAVDVFMCGDADPQKAVEVLKDVFAPKMLTVSEHRRGMLP